MKTLIVIPARFKSSRFPGKPLAKIKNKEMIIWVAQTCKNIIGNSNIIVATDDLRIKKVVNNYGFKPTTRGLVFPLIGLILVILKIITS